MNDKDLDAVDIRVVGTGSIGRQYLSCLSEPAKGLRIGVSVSGRSTRETDDSKFIKESFNCGERPLVDLCIVASRTSRHVKDALEFGPSCQRMIIEKPVAATLIDAWALLENRAQLPAPVYVASPLRFMSGFADSRMSLPQVGNVCSVEIECMSWLPNWRPQSDYRASYSATAGEGGVLLDMIHEIDYAIALFGLPGTVSAKLSNEPTLAIPVEAHAEVSFRYSTHRIRLRLSFGSRRVSRKLIVKGTEAILEWDLLSGRTMLHREGKDRTYFKEFPEDTHRTHLLRQQIRGVLSSGDRQSPATLSDGLLALYLADLARASHAFNGREMEVSSSAFSRQFHC